MNPTTVTAFLDEMVKISSEGKERLRNAALMAIPSALIGSLVSKSSLKGAVGGALVGGTIGALAHPGTQKEIDDIVDLKQKRAFKDQLPGGLADKKGLHLKDFPKKKLEEGASVEKEHTKSKSMAKEIAMDHLVEDMEYYKKLRKIEGKDKTAFMANLGTEIRHTARPIAQAGADLLRRGWSSGSGWMGAGKEIPRGAGMLRKGYENVASLGGLTKHLPVGPKSLTVAGAALGANEARKKEDPSGKGRSRAERVGGVVGGTIGGIAGGAMGLPGAIATGVGGEYLGARIGRAIKGRKPAPVPNE